MTRRTLALACQSVLLVQMSLSAVAYVASSTVALKFRQLGFPDWLRVELAVAIAVGVVVLCLPRASRLQEWAYAGFSILFVTAFFAHAFGGDTWWLAVTPLVSLVLLFISYFSRVR